MSAVGGGGGFSGVGQGGGSNRRSKTSPQEQRMLEKHLHEFRTPRNTILKCVTSALSRTVNSFCICFTIFFSIVAQFYSHCLGRIKVLRTKPYDSMTSQRMPHLLDAKSQLVSTFKIPFMYMYSYDVIGTFKIGDFLSFCSAWPSLRTLFSNSRLPTKKRCRAKDCVVTSLTSCPTLIGHKNRFTSVLKSSNLIHVK